MKTRWVWITTRWREAKPTTRLFWRALFFGITSATFAGAFIGFAFEFEDAGFDPIGFAEIGMKYGFIAAPVFAVVMKMIADHYKPIGGSPARFRLAMGGLVLIGVGISAPYLAVYIALSVLLSSEPGSRLSSIAIILMWVFGVYLSQVLAKQFIAEVSPRKPKEKQAEDSVKLPREIHSQVDDLLTVSENGIPDD